MTLIRDLKPDNIGLGWLEGKFDSMSLFSGEISITIEDNTDEAKEYAESCVAHYNALNNSEDLTEQIQDKMAKFMLYMNEEWNAMGIYDDITKEMNPVLNSYKEGRKLWEFLSKPTLLVVLPENGDTTEIGYVIEADCPWEPEHQCSIIIRGNDLKYVGPSEGNTPWDEEDEYYCIWNDEDEEDNINQISEYNKNENTIFSINSEENAGVVDKSYWEKRYNGAYLQNPDKERFVKKEKELDIERFTHFADEWGFEFPKLYVDFLKKYNGIEIDKEFTYFDCRGTKNTSTIPLVLPFGQAIPIFEFMQSINKAKNVFFPIAITPVSISFYALKVKGKNKGKIYEYFDESMILCFDSIDEFFDILGIDI